MILSRVTYELFGPAAKWSGRDFEGDCHYVKREIHLHGDDDDSIFVSWATRPFKHCVAYSDKSFFQPPAPVIRDVSDSQIWRPLIGLPIAFAFLVSKHQVLQISAGELSVYCASTNGDAWYEAVVSVSTVVPRGF